MARCLIGCGSNVGGRHDFLDRAMELLRFMPGVTLVDVSRYRDTRPIGGPAGQGAFLNGACLIETDLAPHDVLQMLAAVENTLHRARDERWGPRTVDLDLLLYDDLVLDSNGLTVPHPRMATRRFVLEPSAEIAADLVHPLADCTLGELLEAISTPHPHIAVVGVPGSGAPEVAMAIADVTLARLVHAPREYFQVGPLATSAAARPDAAERVCHEAVAACAAQLAADRWPEDPHGTVVDFWLHSVRVAAADVLAADAYRGFEQAFVQAAGGTVPPHVAILLRVSPAVLEERITFRSRHVQASTDAFADLDPSSVAVCPAAAESAARLVRLQDHLAAALLGSGSGRRPGPRAVVAVDADDLGQAIDEAVAAVEAMA
jgi:2-amino-4-hydroxy-6-hydroxymethyldihydropteridine diphosphokinase